MLDVPALYLNAHLQDWKDMLSMVGRGLVKFLIVCPISPAMSETVVHLLTRFSF